MQRLVIGAVALLVIVAAGGGALYRLSRVDELPEPYGTVVKDIFPESDVRSAAPGTALDRVYAQFERPAPPAVGVRCVSFRYDPLLCNGALVILARDNVIEKRWLITSEDLPPECDGVARETVDLRGWYAAAVRIR